jgi:hypothetical protein
LEWIVPRRSRQKYNAKNVIDLMVFRSVLERIVAVLIGFIVFKIISTNLKALPDRRACWLKTRCLLT